MKNWRNILSEILNDPQEAQRLLDRTGLSPASLQRWADGHTLPRVTNLRLLFQHLRSQDQERLLPLLSEDPQLHFSPEAATQKIEQASFHERHIPSAFYDRILSALALTPPPLLFRSFSQLVLDQMLKQFDPDRLGMLIALILCMPPVDGKIRSLREVMRVGSGVWESEAEEGAAFWGAGTLPARAVTLYRCTAASQREPALLPLPQTMSALACPFLRATHVGGCVLVCSTQPTGGEAAALTLLQAYANAIAPVLNQDQFYDSRLLGLDFMPDREAQQRFMQTFPFYERITRLMKARGADNLNVSQAEQLVWQEVEEELLRLI